LLTMPCRPFRPHRPFQVSLMTLSANGIDRCGFLASSARRACTTLRKRYLDWENGLVDQLARDKTVSFKRFKAA
jgi:hypothetical protein